MVRATSNCLMPRVLLCGKQGQSHIDLYCTNALIIFMDMKLKKLMCGNTYTFRMFNIVNIRYSRCLG